MAKLWVSVIAALALLSVAHSKTVSPSDPSVQYSGRFDFTDPNSVSYDWTDVQISLGFSGTSVGIYLKDNLNEYGIFIDGKELPKLITANGTAVNLYPIAKGLANTNHNLIVVKRTEPAVGSARFAGFEVDASATLSAPIPWFNTSRKIEFVGDSLTCAYGDEGIPPCPFTPGTENGWLSWAAVVSRAMKAEFHIAAWSGRGTSYCIAWEERMVRNYGEKTTTSAEPLPFVYPRTVASRADSPKWDFSKWVPQAVVILLGNNDYSTFPQPPLDVFENGYLKFMSDVLKVYPNTKFFMACGFYCRSPCCDNVHTTFLQAKKQFPANKIVYIDFDGAVPPSDEGCAGHPNVNGQRRLAERALPTIQKEMNWF